MVSHNEQSDFHVDKNNIKFAFYIGLYKMVIEKVCNISNFPIKTYRNKKICVHMPKLHPSASLLHLKSRREFATGCKLAPGFKFLKHRSHGQNYTRGANLHSGCKFAPGCKLCILTQL